MPAYPAGMGGGFYLGTHMVSHCASLPRCCVSINRLAGRRTGFKVGTWMLDSGAFTEVTTHGRFRSAPSAYAAQVRRWAMCGSLQCAVSQDYMCEPFALAKTGLTVTEHQRLTVERYDALVREQLPTYLLPVIQGFTPQEYQRHVRLYGDRLSQGAWVGVGSVCKRNGDPTQVWHVLRAVHAVRPDLKLHGFGLKLTAILDVRVRRRLHSADSMAWSKAARLGGKDANGLKEALAYYRRIMEVING